MQILEALARNPTAGRSVLEIEGLRASGRRQLELRVALWQSVG